MTNFAPALDATKSSPLSLSHHPPSPHSLLFLLLSLLLAAWLAFSEHLPCTKHTWFCLFIHSIFITAYQVGIYVPSYGWENWTLVRWSNFPKARQQASYFSGKTLSFCPRSSDKELKELHRSALSTEDAKHIKEGHVFFRAAQILLLHPFTVSCPFFFIELITIYN